MFDIFCFKKGQREAFQTKNVKHFLSVYQAFFVSNVVFVRNNYFPYLFLIFSQRKDTKRYRNHGLYNNKKYYKSR